MSNGTPFKFKTGGGGTVIDPDCVLSAIEALEETYGDRLDWDDLLEYFDERASIAEFEGQMKRAEAEALAAEEVKKLIDRRAGK